MYQKMKELFEECWEQIYRVWFTELIVHLGKTRLAKIKRLSKCKQVENVVSINEEQM